MFNIFSNIGNIKSLSEMSLFDKIEKKYNRENKLKERQMHWVYIVQCSDGTYYTGYTTDLNRRIKEHNESKKGAKYTRVRRPVTLQYFESYGSRQEACRREYEIKQLSRKQKEKLIKS